jgi:predicted ribosome quality control (RQC) complex YloA/Tae2 family protein
MLICELFSKGNMILVDDKLKIRGLLESQNWQSRTIRGGVVYEYPPAQADTPMLSEQEFSEMIKNSGKDLLVKTLAIDFGLGGIYSEELCLQAKIDKNEKNTTQADAKKLFVALQQMIDERTRPNKLGDDFFPFETMNPEKKQIVFFESFSKALDSELSEKTSTLAEQNNISEQKTKENKAAVVLQKQKERLAELEQSVIENQRKGELIYEHYAEIKELLDKINADRKKLSWEELKKKYKENKLIKEIDEKQGLLKLEL